jgi:hypothetical protein
MEEPQMGIRRSITLAPLVEVGLVDMQIALLRQHGRTVSLSAAVNWALAFVLAKQDEVFGSISPEQNKFAKTLAAGSGADWLFESVKED